MEPLLPPSTFKFDNIPSEQKPDQDYKGVDENNKITSVFNHKGEINKSVNFKERSVKRVFQNTQSIKQSKNKHEFQTNLAKKRAEILSKATTHLTIKENDDGSDSGIERALLGLVDECKTDQTKNNNEFIKVKGLKKQINKDIKKYFSNELIMAGTPDKLRQLSGRFSNIQDQLNKDTRKDIQSMIDHRCDRVVEQLETHMEQSDIRSIPADIALGAKCRFTTDWTDAIEAVSKKSFKNNKQALGSLIFKVWGIVLTSVKPHPSNLKETKNSLDTIQTLSPMVEKCIKKTLDTHSNAYNRTTQSTKECVESLENELGKIPDGVKNYHDKLNEIYSLTDQIEESKTKALNLQKEVDKKSTEQAVLKEKKTLGVLGKHKIFRRLSPDYQHERGKIKDARGTLSKELTKATLAKNTLQNELETAKEESVKLATDTQTAIEKYALSIKALDVFSDLPYTDVSGITTEGLRKFLEGKQILDTVTLTYETQALPSPVSTSSTDYGEQVDPRQPALNELADQQFSDFDPRNEIEGSLEFFIADDSTDRSIESEDLAWIEERGNYSMNVAKVDLKALSSFISYYQYAFNMKSDQGTYHNTQALFDGYEKGLQLLEASQTVDQAKITLNYILVSPQQTTPRPIEEDQDRHTLKSNLTSPTNTNERPGHHINKRESSSATPINRQSSPLNLAAQSSLLDKIPLETQVYNILNKYAQLEESTTDGDSGFGEMRLSFKDGEREQAIKALQPVLTDKFKKLKQDEVEELANKLCELKTVDEEKITKTLNRY
ncbi:hypothetical protein [Endozoicomonas ascidiicola]|uniref:hypothetical protein n=1 Tax=Endozoicomonas ascidiicola TaxID=1698521 RepID=UPI00082C6E37|nr:hypothetical protein [Endozoicomonas ascidiicola]